MAAPPADVTTLGMTVTHARFDRAGAENLSVEPLLASYTGKIPRHELPAGEMPPDVAYQIIHDELMLDGNARMNLATFVSTWMEPQAEKLMSECFDKNMIDKDEYPQTAELERALRQHSEPSLAFARLRRGDRLLDDRLERGRDAWRSGAEAALAAPAGRRGQARGQAEHRHGHQRPSVLGEVRELLGRGDAAGSDGGRPPPHERRGGGEAVRREHDRRGSRARLDVRRLVRAGQGDLRRPRRPAGEDGTRHPRPRRRRVGSVHRAVHRPGAGVGLPAAAGRLDQRVGPQVRARLPRASAG